MTTHGALFGTMQASLFPIGAFAMAGQPLWTRPVCCPSPSCAGVGLLPAPWAQAPLLRCSTLGRSPGRSSIGRYPCVLSCWHVGYLRGLACRVPTCSERLNSLQGLRSTHLPAHRHRQPKSHDLAPRESERRERASVCCCRRQEAQKLTLPYHPGLHACPNPASPAWLARMVPTGALHLQLCRAIARLTKQQKPKVLSEQDPL